MPTIIDGTAGITFPNSTVQASAGQVFQVVNATTTSQTITSSGTYVATSLTASITPKFSTSKILVIGNYQLYVAVSDTKTITGLYRNASLISDGCAMLYFTSSAIQATCGFNYLDSPATTSSTSYSIYLKSSFSGRNAYFNPDGYIAGITLLEIAG